MKQRSCSRCTARNAFPRHDVFGPRCGNYVGLLIRRVVYIVVTRLMATSMRSISASGRRPVPEAAASAPRPTFNPDAEARLAAALAPAEISETEPAQAYTRRLTRTHYENFSVVSLLLPKALRQDFCNVYAFCRIADDMADELADQSRALRLLAELRAQTEACYAGHPRTRLFVALASTIERHQVPMQPFLDLIDAFEQDQRVDRYDTFAQLVDYCRRSADPVGRLVLYMCGYRDAERHRLSDRTCTALQLTNFWQDVRRDLLDRNRVYIPRESLDQFGVSESQIRQGTFDDRFIALMRFEVDRTQKLFDEGSRLPPMLNAKVRRHIALFGQGGEAILQAIRRQRYDTLSRRPTLSRWQKTRLILAAVGAGVAGSLARGNAA